MLMLLVMIRNLLNLSYFSSSCDNVVNIKKLNVSTTIQQWQRVLFYAFLNSSCDNDKETKCEYYYSTM
jgi:hypothetical protein